jgi:hypothetical protein
MGSSTREPTPSVFGFGRGTQGTQGYQAAPIYMKDGQAYTRTGGPQRQLMGNKGIAGRSAGLTAPLQKGGVEPAPYSYQPISFGQPNQQANPAQSQAYGPGKYGVARKYGEQGTGSQNYYQSGQSASDQAQRNLNQRKARKAQEATFEKGLRGMKNFAKLPF